MSTRTAPATAKHRKSTAQMRSPSGRVVRHILGGKVGPARLAGIVKAGIPASELAELKELFDLSSESLAEVVGVSKATLNRRRPEHLLTGSEADRVVRFARLFAIALEVMGTEEHARAWFKSPQVALGGSKPLDYALTEIGAREVEDLLARIEHGVYT